MLFVWILLLSPVLAGLEWQLVANESSTSPPRRSDHAMGFVSLGNSSYLILFAGRSYSNQPMHDTWIFEMQDNTAGVWRNVTKSMHPPARFSMVYGSSDGYFYIATGEGINQQYFNDFWKFDTRTNEWTELGRTAMLNVTNLFHPQSRYGAAGGIFPGGSKFFVHQGFSHTRHFDTLVFDVNTMEWNIVDCKAGQCNSYTPYYPHARCLHAGTLLDPNKLVIFGGCLSGGGTGGECPSGDTWMFDSQTLSWTEYPSCPVPRIYGSMAMLPSRRGQNRVLLYGGIEDTPQVIQTTKSPATLVGLFDPSTRTWSLHKTNAKQSFPVSRASVAMVTGHDGIFMFGGYDVNRGSLLGDLWFLRGDAYTAQNTATVSCSGSFTNFILAHGCLMVIGWGIFTVWGAFIARYAKSSGKTWFYLHIILQVTGQLCSIAGFIMAVLSVQSQHFGFAHGIIGLVVVILGILQPINAVFRPLLPKPYCRKSFRRILWEFIHHFGGTSGILLALANISLGVFVANTRSVAWVVWFVYLGIVVVVNVVSHFAQECLENRRKPMEFLELIPGSEKSIYNYKPKMAEGNV
ncbi:kelch domain-containing protein 10-like [Saccostrea echinata]|uniref:kelch domain-containing protein 10-like n=1 Tax=Saccostrea echinata TaxID=191078 RepID=UPI002A7FF8D1|nr:kelch domain-containing protein 10-like [Saccostrea echinata]